MKKSELKQLIKEEYSKIINEDYRDDVKDHFGDTLSEKTIKKIIDQHGSFYQDYVQDTGGSLKTDDLLDWLGY